VRVCVCVDVFGDCAGGRAAFVLACLRMRIYPIYMLIWNNKVIYPTVDYIPVYGNNANLCIVFIQMMWHYSS